VVATNHPQGRQASDQDRDHSAAAALSSLATIPTATVASSTTSGKAYRSSDPAASPTGAVGANEIETYEWDEGGDEKELSTDAMGATSTRDSKPGFFGMFHVTKD
jgi:hypothetical protein